MISTIFEKISDIFSHCHRTLDQTTWGRVLAAMDEDLAPAAFPEHLENITAGENLPGYLADLARIEWILHLKKKESQPASRQVSAITVNPTLTIIPVGWKNLTTLLQSPGDPDAPIQKAEASAHMLFWLHPLSGRLRFNEAEDIDLLALKLIVEGIDFKDAATAGQVTIGDIQSAVDQAVNRGILLSPDSKICRFETGLESVDPRFKPYISAHVFTLQWHITQACELHCKHCYDRSDRDPMALDTALGILEDLYDFCRRMHVKGQVTFTGGNPLLYPHFRDVYRAAADYGFGIAILGNPTPLARIRQLIAIAEPRYFQISLEGLKAHNDTIRGKGHFERSLAFLEGLRSLVIETMVMLTLTSDNLDQVLPLAELLRDKADHFTFNRLATVGEGANLMMPDKAAFKDFLLQYEAAAVENPIIGLKDNLINILREEKDEPLFGGCTGYGCGAAFNFLTLLSDGEVHACRKFPSPIGNIASAGFHDLYNSPSARRYRSGSRECLGCHLNVVCRGCLAITHSLGLDVFGDKDPFCFASPQPSG